MTKHTFTQKEVFTKGWSDLKKHAWFLAIAFFISTIIVTSVAKTGLLEVLAMLIVSIALIGVSIQIAHGHTPTFADLFNHFKSHKVFVNYTLASIVYGLLAAVTVGGVLAILSVLAFGTTFDFDITKSIPVLTGAGIVLLIGFYYLIRLQFYKYIIIENETITAITALKKSYHLTKGNSVQLIVYIILVVLLNILGAIPLGLGLIITVPLTLLTSAEIYKKLSSQE